MPESLSISERISEDDLHRILVEDLALCQPFARIGRYFRGILHNLNGRLQCALLQVELLRMPLQSGGYSLDPKQFDLRLKHLTAELNCLSEMLRFWGQQADHESLLREGWVDVNQIIHKALAFMDADPFFKHQVSTEINLQDDLPPVYGNEFALANVFGPLLENAVEAMRSSDQRRLFVATCNEGAEVRVAIQHTGCRLQEGPGDDLFSPPINGERRWRESTSGIQLHSRLGLYLAKHMVRPCGGAITCENRQDHSVFIVQLPLKQHGV